MIDRNGSQWAGILCNDPRFQKFAAIRSGVPNTQFNQAAAAEYLRNCCGIRSRRDLNRIESARKRFAILQTEFDMWTGKQASPR
ncbi:MAG: hypothetical protein ABJO67_15405 [Pseudoruegeria sp.]